MTNKKKILIVDDEEAIRSLMSRALMDEYICHTACEGREALDKLEQDDYDIVITDLNMPGMGGMELCRVTFQTYPQIPVIIITGYQNLLQEAEAMRLALFCVAKPFTTEQIHKAIADALASRVDYETYIQSRPECPPDMRWPADAVLD